jgi:hypothetical protein
MDKIEIRVVPRPWNKGTLVGQKTPFKLNEIRAIPVRLQIFLPNAGIGAVRSWHRQQVAGLRPAQAKGSRRLSRRAGRCTGERRAKKDFKTRAVRDHGVDPRPLWPTGSDYQVSRLTAFSSQAVFMRRLI